MDLRALPRNRAVIAILGALVIAAGVAAAFVAVAAGGDEAPQSPAESPPPSATASPSRTPSPTPVPPSNPLNGAPMSPADYAARKGLLPVGLMIDNNPSAYPHSGLDTADIVIEAFVEGGITRFLAIWWSRDADFIEPVRSARTPFLYWALEFDSLLGHAGVADLPGEADAATQIRDWGIHDMDAFVGTSATAYYRDPARYAPHNLVTSTRAIWKAAEAMGLAGPADIDPWPFRGAGAPPPGGAPAAALEVNFGARSSSWRTVQWHWDPAARAFLRFQFGGPHIDAKSGAQIAATTVIVMEVPWAVVDSSGHVVYEQVGSGPGTIFIEGRALEATWSKPGRDDRTRFLDSAGRDVPLAPGTTWIEMIGPAEELIVAATLSDIPPLPVYVAPQGFTPIPDDESPTASATVGASATPPPSTPSPTAITTPGSPTSEPTEEPTSESPVASPTPG
ncbi:MAG TPA: DUF3048 domain-containing protein [Tepidiformaceae bacterium]|nr:DUF3048 domain-containing protein [Tepidiformaceae bacterium]